MAKNCWSAFCSRTSQPTHLAKWPTPFQFVLAKNVENDEAIKCDRDGNEINSIKIDLGKVYGVFLWTELSL